MTITITGFAQSPDRGAGLARDMRVRWALEEAALPYAVRLLSFAQLKEPDHLSLHPFGQFPTFEDGHVSLFESGAIVLHIAQRRGHMMPVGESERARTVAWMFAATNTVEPPILELATARILEGDKPWTVERTPLVMDRVRARLQQLAAFLGTSQWLEGSFSAADLMMISVLLRLKPSGLLREFPVLADYVARGEARGAYQRAFEAQYAVFAGGATDKERAR